MSATTDFSKRAGGILSIDLDAIARNYLFLCDQLGGATCAAVVKADAYGLGVAHVAPKLRDAGCSVFFVATIDEGIFLRGLLGDEEIHVFNGLAKGCEPDYAEHRLVPVLGSLGEIDLWRKFCARKEILLPADIHIDTGMSRLGLPPYELDVLVQAPSKLEGMEISHIISHLACANTPSDKMNQEQLERFIQAKSALPRTKASLANSAGIFLGPQYHFDLARPGIALYGGAPQDGAPNQMAQAVKLQGKILQVRDVDTPQSVGYGAAHRVKKRGKIASVALGYADGYFRSLGNKGSAYFGDIRVPVVGQVSMDIITLDVSGVPESHAHPGALVDLIGPNYPLDHIAADAGTIGYEVLCALSSRYHRVYLNSGSQAP
jgi:alanine racemase